MGKKTTPYTTGAPSRGTDRDELSRSWTEGYEREAAAAVRPRQYREPSDKELALHREIGEAIRKAEAASDRKAYSEAFECWDAVNGLRARLADETGKEDEGAASWEWAETLNDAPPADDDE